MPSEIDISNEALDLLGEPPITSFLDGNKAANLCQRNYPVVRDYVLRSFDWSYARTRLALNASVEAPVSGFEYQYPLPTNPYCLRVLDVESDDGRSAGEGDVVFSLEGRNILTDEETCIVLYTARITDVNDMDAMLMRVIAARLAFDMVSSFGGGPDRYELMLRTYHLRLNEAMLVAAMENPPAKMTERTWVDER